jgi:uncharacterized membrane protein
MRRYARLGLLAAVAAVLLLIGGAAGASPDLTALVSLNSNGIQGSSDSLYPCISTDGRYVAFTSYATNLVENDTNATSDIFVRDREAWATTRVSVKTDGTQGNDASSNCAISADGRYVAFESYATNLVDNDTNGKRDVFVHDRQTGTTTRVSVKSDGSEANARSEQSAISGDGRYVAFQSQASNLVDGDTNGLQDVFVHDRQDGATTRASVRSDGTQGNDASEFPAISADGRYVAFDSLASNLVDGDTNGKLDIFVHDRQTGATTRASVKSDGSQGNGPSYYPSISDDGRYVAFDSRASNLVDGDSNGASDVFVHDRQTGATTRVSVKTDGSEGNNDSDRSTISADGRFVAFASYATNLVEGDTNATKDIFLHDRQAAVTSRVSVDSGGIQGNSYSDYPAISADGRYVVFHSAASNLVSGDTNGRPDVFVLDRAEYPSGGTHYYNVQFRAEHIWLDGQDLGAFVGKGTATVVRGDPYWNESGKECADYHIESLTLTGFVNNVPVEIDVGEGLTVPVSSGTICEGAVGFDVTLSLYVEETDGGGSLLSSSPTLATDGHHLCNCWDSERWSSIDCTAVISEVPPNQVTYECATSYQLCNCSTNDPRVTVDTPQTGAFLLAVGGIAEWPGATAGSDQSAPSSSGSGFNYIALGGALAAAAIVVLAAGACLARRRWAR